MRTHVFGITLLVLLAAPAVVDAQFWARTTNPTIEVELRHPPGLDIRVDTIAFGPVSGGCSDGIVQELISDFVSNGLRVVERRNLDRLLEEHDLTLSRYVDSSTAARIGRLLGPSAIIMVDVQRCVHERDRSRGGSSVVRALFGRGAGEASFRSRTRVFVDASVRAIDLATGRIFAARTLNHVVEETNSNPDEYPEYPSESGLFDDARALVVRDVHRMFLPWTERRELIYFDDRDCDLNDAYRALAAGNAARALRISLENLDRCAADPMVDPKDLGQAHYNVGMSYMIEGEYDHALEHLERSARLRPGDIVEEARSDVVRARELVDEMRQVEERFEYAAQSEEDAEGTAGEVLTNDGIVTMSQQGLPEVIILAKMSSSTCEFDTSPAALAALNRAGVSENVILAMLNAK